MEVLKLFLTPYFSSVSWKSSPPSIAFKEIVWQLASTTLKKVFTATLKKVLEGRRNFDPQFSHCSISHETSHAPLDT